MATAPKKWPYGRDETERRLAAYGGSPWIMAIAEGIPINVAKSAVIAYGLPFIILPRGGPRPPRRHKLLSPPPTPAPEPLPEGRVRTSGRRAHRIRPPAPPDPDAYHLIRRGRWTRRQPEE